MTGPMTGDPDWDKVLDEQEASGLSVAAWCEEVGIRPHLIYSRKRARAARRTPRPRGPTAFVPVKVTATSTRLESRVPAHLRIRVAGGRTIEIEGDVDVALLARVVLALEALPCS